VNQKVSSALRFIDTISDWSGKIVSFIIVFMITFMGYEVVLRYIFNAPTLWVFETVQFLFGAFCILGGAYALRHRAHVNMEVVYVRFPLRMRAIVDLITSTLFFFFIVVLLWGGWEFAWRSVQTLETTFTPWNPPLYPLKLTIPIAASLILLQGLAKFVRDLIVAITRREMV